MSTHKAIDLRLLGIVATAFAVAACGGGGGRDMQPANTAPTVSAIADSAINQDTTTDVSILVADTESGADPLTLSATSSDALLLADTGIAMSGSGTTRKLSLTPAENAYGTATVTVTVADPQGLSSTRSFLLTVNPVFVSYTGFVTDTFGVAGDESSRSLKGITLDSDADENDTAFDALLQ
jgi:hypothetical protein